jgi:hypothetical protein
MKAVYFIFIFFLLIISARAEVFTSPDGFRFEVNLQMQKTSIMLGEPVYMDFEVKNLSAVDLGILYGGDYQNEFARPESFDVRVFDAASRIVPKPPSWNFGGMASYQKCPAGQVHSFRLYLPHWAMIGKTGDYRVEIAKDLVVKEYTPKNIGDFTSKKAVPIKLNAEFKIIPSNEREMGEIIDAIGAKLVEGDDTAERLAPFINDDRIIKYLAEAITKNIWLMRNLAKFNDDRALKAIVSRMGDQDQEVRRNVSVTLALSVHPQAADYILQMRGDKYYAIRLDVIHFLGKRKTAESTKVLKEMLRDENEQNKMEAKRYLTERGEN